MNIELIKLALLVAGACFFGFIFAVVAAFAIAMLSSLIVYTVNALAEMFRRKFWKGYDEDITED